MNDYEFILEDRIAKIQAINNQYDLEHNSYISFSGGKDSVILSHLIDLALPNNYIPRVFINTGIEFVDLVKYVKSLASEDDRIIIINNKLNIKKTLNQYGYPFKSKEHSQKYAEGKKSYIKNGKLPDYLIRYRDGIKEYTAKDGTIKKSILVCPQKLQYQFEPNCNLNISKMCCNKFKKEPLALYEKENNKTIAITGMRKAEGSSRLRLSCLSHNNTKFHPLSIVSEEWENEFIKRNNINLCKLYYYPYNFIRTGCKGCPYTKDIQDKLDMMYKLLPNEYKQCLHLWSYVYDEYIRLGYRLTYYPHEKE